MDIYAWARQWNIPLKAIHDLQHRMGVRMAGLPEPGEGAGEAATQSRVRLEASKKGVYLWRNNVGACTDENGNHIRYGLANDSAKMNRVIKSSDLIGIRPVIIQPHHVGHKFGQFVAREMKAEKWYYTGTEREEAQRRFIELVVSQGGSAQFCIGEGSL